MYVKHLLHEADVACLVGVVTVTYLFLE